MSNKWTLTSRMCRHGALSPAQREQWRWAYLSVLVVLVAAPIAILAISLMSNWDLALADWAFDTTSRTFPLRHTWLTAQFNHVILKWIFTLLGLGFVGLAAWDFFRPLPWCGIRRFQMRVVALSAVCVPAVISLLKSQSDSHCPWDLQRYGGTAPYVRLFDILPDGVLPGNCMPAGHASSALWLVSLAIFFVPQRVRLAALTLAGFLLLGLAVGWMQQLRGAHFLTHTLWSLWIALVTVSIVTLTLDCWPESRVHATH